VDYYEIVVEGTLDAAWSDWFGGLTATSLPGGRTRLVGPVADQAALHGLLAALRNLNLALVSVQRHKADP